MIARGREDRHNSFNLLRRSASFVAKRVQNMCVAARGRVDV
jgi:hypothetical protein